MFWLLGRLRCGCVQHSVDGADRSSHWPGVSWLGAAAFDLAPTSPLPCPQAHRFLACSPWTR